MQEIIAPKPVPWDVVRHPSVFLAGSIDMGQAADWQALAVRALNDLPGTILNPRRAQWDASWPQDPRFAPFAEQVTWELEGLERSDWVLMHLDADSKAPVSMLELGLHARSGRIVVSCPPEFWRAGNVQIVCTRMGIPLFCSLDFAIAALRRRLPAR
jgi:hypothetical protein